MEVLKVLLLSALLSAVAGGNKVKKLKVEIEALESAFATVLDDTEAAIANLTARIDTMEAERVELDKAHAWQALHMAAAAARCTEKQIAAIQKLLIQHQRVHQG